MLGVFWAIVAFLLWIAGTVAAFKSSMSSGLRPTGATITKSSAGN